MPGSPNIIAGQQLDAGVQGKSLAGAIIPAIISLAGSIGATAIGNKIQSDAIANQNAYNSPKAQMQRYLDAGLNPYLIYGNGQSSAGNQSQIGSYQSGADAFNSLMSFGLQLPQLQQDMKESEARISNMAAQNEEIRANVRLKTIEALFQEDTTEARKLAIKLANDVTGLTADDIRYKLDNLNPAQLASTYASTVKTYADAAKAYKDIEYIGKQMNWTDQQIKESKKRMQKMTQDILESKSREHLNYMNADVAGWNRDFFRDTHSYRVQFEQNRSDNSMFGNHPLASFASGFTAKLMRLFGFKPDSMY